MAASTRLDLTIHILLTPTTDYSRDVYTSGNRPPTRLSRKTAVSLWPRKDHSHDRLPAQLSDLPPSKIQQSKSVHPAWTLSIRKRCASAIHLLREMNHNEETGNRVYATDIALRNAPAWTPESGECGN